MTAIYTPLSDESPKTDHSAVNGAKTEANAAKYLGEAAQTKIYHGTPLTPRAALTSVCAGRAMCVSFYRPDDVEEVERISPAIMFRQRRVLILAGGAEARRRMVLRRIGLGSVLSLARQETVSSRPMGDHTGRAGCAVPAQRWVSERLAIRSQQGRAGVAHGRADRAPSTPVRAIRSGLSWLDWAEGWIAGLSRADGRGGDGARQPLACLAHAARNGGGLRLSLRQRGQHVSGTERVAL